MNQIPKASEISTSEYIDTGLPQLNKILGGGIPLKRITEISGQWSSGKTSLALQVISNAQKLGYECIFFDAEWAWENLYAKKLAVDTDKLGLIQTRAAEDGLDILLEYLEGDKVKKIPPGRDTLFVIDAVGALHPRDEAEKDAGSRTIGSQSALVARFCRKVVPMLWMNNCALIVLNHEYTPIEMQMPGRPPQVKTSGGKKLEYHKSVWLRLSRIGMNLKVGEKFVGFKVKAEVKKNKLADTEKQFAEMEFFYNRGFNPTSDLKEDALEAGVLVREGNTFFAFGEKIGGKSKLQEWMDIPENVERLKEALG